MLRKNRPTMPKLPLSVVIITLNAATQLRACLDSVAAWSDEIIIVDSGSQDSTQEIAQTYPQVRWITQKWLGFGPQKRFAVQQAQYDWVLCLDADERISPRLQEQICHLLETQPAPALYRFARSNFFLGRFLKHGEGYPDWSPRLFHRHAAEWSADLVHEKIIAKTNQPCLTLQGDLLHESAETLATYLTKQNHYTTLQATDLIARGKRVTRLQIILSPLIRFIKFYIFRLGFLDGFAGLVHIAIGCFNSFIKYCKVYEKQSDQ